MLRRAVQAVVGETINTVYVEYEGWISFARELTGSLVVSTTHELIRRLRKPQGQSIIV